MSVLLCNCLAAAAVYHDLFCVESSVCEFHVLHCVSTVKSSFAVMAVFVVAVASCTSLSFGVSKASSRTAVTSVLSAVSVNVVNTTLNCHTSFHMLGVARNKLLAVVPSGATDNAVFP